ncbi:PIN domain-containing protein [Candidatus Parabeggiatoa sp. HSG14]|uniref:type II toxin-antitoxin system VapC family toxin n=1 Tax=Candidatus Parabeggiatoa sp. HSG14 TaxID=3055593 RepID=UPI0025A8F347|nr:PIN domain-containing protein [Thiotrichales bacterium HSG14]
MRYLADSVALIRHLRKHRRLGQQARKILQEADAEEHTIFVSAVSLMEILYLAQAKKITVDLAEVMTLISNSPNYTLVPIDADVVLAAATVDDAPELHDRILVGTAKHLQVPILTSDQIITQSSHVQTVWK